MNNKHRQCSGCEERVMAHACVQGVVDENIRELVRTEKKEGQREQRRYQEIVSARKELPNAEDD